MHDLTGLVEHLHLLLRVAIVLEHVNLRNHVVCQLISELVDGWLLAFHQFLVLLLQFSHSSGTSTRSALVACHMDALDVTQLLNRLENHHHHDGSTVGVGNDATRTVEGIGSVALRHHQWHIIIHTEGTGVVNHYSTKLGDVLSKLL